MCFGGGDQAPNTNLNPAPYAPGNAYQHVKQTVTPGGTIQNPNPPSPTPDPNAKPQASNDSFAPTTGLAGPM